MPETPQSATSVDTATQWYQTTGSDGKVYKTQARSAQEAMQKFAPYKQPRQTSQPTSTFTQQGVPIRGLVTPTQPQYQLPKNYGFTNKNVAQAVYHGAEGLVKGTVEMGKDLLSNPNWVSGKDSTAQKFVYGPADAEYAKAKKAYTEGRYSEAFGHGAASLIPFMGPWAAHLGERAGTGDIGGATGEAVGAVGTGAVAKLGADKATEFVDPTKLREKAAELNTKVLKQADTSKVDYKLSAGLQVAQEHIIGTLRSLPTKIEAARQVKAADVQRMASAADQAGVKIDITPDIDPVLRDVATLSNQRGLWTPQLRDQISSLIKRVEMEAGPNGPLTVPRNLKNLTVTQALDLTRGLEDLSAFGKDAPAAINNVARRLRGAINDKLPAPIQTARAAESRLIIARDAAKENFKNVLNDKSTMGRGVLYSGAGTLGVYLALRGSGVMPMAAIGSVILLRSMAASATSRTMRAALYARAADIIDGATRANAAPSGPAGAGSAMQGPLAPRGPQPTQNTGLTQQMGAPSATPRQLPAAPSTASQPAVNTIEATSWHNEALAQAKAKLPNASMSEQLQEAAKIQKAGKPTTSVAPGNTGMSVKNKSMMDRLDTLLERQASPKSGADRNAIEREISEIKQSLSGEASAEAQKKINKRIADRERLQGKRQQAAQQQSGTGVSTSGEAVAGGMSPEQRVMLLDAGYKKLATYEGGPQMVKALQATAKAMSKVDQSYDEVSKLAEALHVLQQLGGGR